MTNTLHRYGSAESFADDYIVFATPSNGKNEIDSLPKLKRFLELALPFEPLGLRPGARLAVALHVLRGEVELERLPRFGYVTLTVPDQDFERVHWRV